MSPAAVTAVTNQSSLSANRVEVRAEAREQARAIMRGVPNWERKREVRRRGVSAGQREGREGMGRAERRAYPMATAETAAVRVERSGRSSRDPAKVRSRPRGMRRRENEVDGETTLLPGMPNSMWCPSIHSFVGWEEGLQLSSGADAS